MASLSRLCCNLTQIPPPFSPPKPQFDTLSGMFRRLRYLRLAYFLITTTLLIVVIWYFLRYIHLVDSLTR